MIQIEEESLEFDGLYIRRERGVCAGLESLVLYTLGDLADLQVRSVLRGMKRNVWKHTSSRMLRRVLLDSGYLSALPSTLSTLYALGTLYTDGDRDNYFLGITRFQGVWFYKDIWTEGVLRSSDAILVSAATS
jgi:hypothetical protein